MDGLSPLINVGAIGAVLWWFLTQTNPRLEALQKEMQAMGSRIEGALDRLTRAQMLTLLNQPETPDALKREAREVLKEVGGDPQARASDR